MTVTVSNAELSNLLGLARELAQMLDAEQNADEEELVEVRLLRAVEHMERRLAANRGADVRPRCAAAPEGGP